MHVQVCFTYLLVRFQCSDLPSSREFDRTQLRLAFACLEDESSLILLLRSPHLVPPGDRRAGASVRAVSLVEFQFLEVETGASHCVCLHCSFRGLGLEPRASLRLVPEQCIETQCEAGRGVLSLRDTLGSNCPGRYPTSDLYSYPKKIILDRMVYVLVFISCN